MSVAVRGFLCPEESHAPQQQLNNFSNVGKQAGVFASGENL
jgi:hypothetical protein